MNIRAYADNVILALEPDEALTRGGIHIPQDYEVRGAGPHAAAVAKRKMRGVRTAIVLASGPGHYKTRRVPASGTLQQHTEECPVFVPNQVKPGDRVLVDRDAGDDYTLDVSAPRHNLPTEFGELIGQCREFRIVREAQIHALVE